MIRTPQADARLSGAFRRAVGGALAVVMVAVGIATAVAAEPGEPSDVVVALDFSDSILSDKPNRTRFADALVEIADRVEVTRDDLVNGNAVISLVPFASRAQGYPGCQGLELHQNPAAVDKLADCLRLAARQYRRGPSAQIVGDVGRTPTTWPPCVRRPSTCRRTRRDRRSSSSPTASTMSRAFPPARSSPRPSACSATGHRSRSCPSAWASIRSSGVRSDRASRTCPA